MLDFSSAPVRQDSESVPKHRGRVLFGDGRILSLAKDQDQWGRTQNGSNGGPETGLDTPIAATAAAYAAEEEIRFSVAATRTLGYFPSGTESR
jgi:hypothetical protein